MTPAAPRWGLPDWAIVAVLTLGFWLLAAHDLGRFHEPIFDETFTFPAVQQVLLGQVPTEQTHPPLSKLFMALGQWLVGGPTPPADLNQVAYGARLFSPVFGALGLVAQYVWVRGLSGRRWVAALAALLLGLDGVYLVMSRAAMTNIYGMAFWLWGLAALWQARSTERRGWLYLAGVAFGCALASRWTAALVLAVAGLWLLWDMRGRRAAEGLLALGLVPLAVYVLSYGQSLWAASGQAVGKLLSPWSLARWWQLQQFAAGSHGGEAIPHPCTAPWWSWPLMLKPTWFFFVYDPVHDAVTAICALGNVAVWWLSLPALAFALHRAWRGDRVMALLAMLILGTWLPWAFSHARSLYMHYFFEAIPAVCAIVAIALGQWAAEVPWRRTAALGYAALAAAWVGYYAPFLYGYPVAMTGYVERLWLGITRWDFGTMVATCLRENHLEDPQVRARFLRKYYPEMEERRKQEQRR